MEDLKALKRCRRRVALRIALEATAFGALAFVTVVSAMWAKESRQAPLLAAVEFVSPSKAPVAPADSLATPTVLAAPATVAEAPLEESTPAAAQPSSKIYPPGTRFYDGRPIKPVKTIMMTVTAYSPDERSCGKWADGITASNKSVWTNAMRLVAADTRILPMHSMISIPGYADGEVVPVLDRGGKIKGNRLDVLYATHEIALQWGVRKLPVTVWGYAD